MSGFYNIFAIEKILADNFSWSAQLRSTTRPFAQWNLILAHLQYHKFNIVDIHRTALYRLKRFTGCASAWLSTFMLTKTNVYSV